MKTSIFDMTFTLPPMVAMTEVKKAMPRTALQSVNVGYGVNRPQFARHFSVIQNDYDRGDYEQKAIAS